MMCFGFLLVFMVFYLQFRGSEIIQLQNYKTATLEDVAAVHSALEKVIFLSRLLSYNTFTCGDCIHLIQDI